jgi:glutamate-ammonia-ligase adenylyltransferase
MRERMHEGHPNRGAEFDLKHDPGGMVDIEFCVQFLVLAHSGAVPGLLENHGNISLLGYAALAGLIEPELARRCADAYRTYRRRSHALRLAEARFVRVPGEEFQDERRAVRALWRALGLAGRTEQLS